MTFHGLDTLKSHDFSYALFARIQPNAKYAKLNLPPFDFRQIIGYTALSEGVKKSGVVGECASEGRIISALPHGKRRDANFFTPSLFMQASLYAPPEAIPL